MRSSTRIRLRSESDFPAWRAAAWIATPDPAVRGVKPPARDAVQRDETPAGPSAKELEALEEALRAEFEERLAAAYQEGLEAGHAAGGAAAAAELQSAHDAATRAAAEIRSREAEWAGVLEENVCALATAVARHVIDREIATDRLIVLEMARSAVERFGLEETLRIRVHPDDYAILSQPQGGAGELATAIEGRPVQWVADAGIEVGGCVVEGRERIVDGRVDTALVRAYRMLAGQHA